MENRRSSTIPVLTVILGLFTPAAGAQLCQTQALTEPVPAANAQFGRAVDIVGPRLVVGASGATVGTHSFSGKVHVFGLGAGGWQHEAEVIPTNPAINLYFGRAVALAGDQLYVGGNPGLNRVDSFRQVAGTWVHQGELPLSGYTYATNFGQALAAEGEWLAVAKPNAVDSSNWWRPGAVVIYRSTGALPFETQVLQPAGLVHNDGFGADVALRGGVLVVGTSMAASAAKVFVYRLQGSDFVEEAVLLPQGASVGTDSLGASFGQDVATDGERIAVADPYEPLGLGHTGTVCIWRHQGGAWVLEQRIAAPLGYTQFGQRIALDGEHLVVSTHPGLRHMHFRRLQGVWTQQAVTPAQNPGQFALSSLALSGTHVVAGSLLNAGSPTNAGHARAFTLGSGLVPYGGALAGAGGIAPQLNGSQCPLVGQPMSLELTGGLGGTPGVLAIGAGSTALNLFGGTVHVNPIISTSAVVLGGAPGAPGAGNLSLPLGTFSPALLGLRVYFQAALFDTAAPQWLSLTNGLEVVVGAL
ncbi:MAG: hypothetical protein GC161_06585 [Planctomycetaceae bacterium]|nr:hypothetical protein [Planctomycetaceae bacterium]